MLSISRPSQRVQWRKGWLSIALVSWLATVTQRKHPSSACLHPLAAVLAPHSDPSTASRAHPALGKRAGTVLEVVGACVSPANWPLTIPGGPAGATAKNRAHGSRWVRRLCLGAVEKGAGDGRVRVACRTSPAFARSLVAPRRPLPDGRRDCSRHGCSQTSRPYAVVLAYLALSTADKGSSANALPHHSGASFCPSPRPSRGYNPSPCHMAPSLARDMCSTWKYVPCPQRPDRKSPPNALT